MSKLIPTIGIECHVQLATRTKLFSGANNDARDAQPNSLVSPIDYGLPGMLPVLNHGAVELAIKAGLALGSEIAPVSRFDRKHYFYPDLPNGYQITQMYEPIIGAGTVKVPHIDGDFDVRIHHAHLEADAGKLTHYDDYSLVDLNRVGTPLIEIVSEPDMHSAAQAKAYARELYLLMTYVGATHGDLFHGNMRFDVNISVASEDSNELGNRAEIKNLNSFRAVEKVVEYEFKRQSGLLEKGQAVEQETRGWDDVKQKTFTQRSKENAPDYRYMPDPDLPPIVLSPETITDIKTKLPKLPTAYRADWEKLQLNDAVLNKILDNAPVAITLDAINERFDDAITKRVFNWFASASSDEVDVASVDSGLVGPRRLAELSQMVEENQLSSTAAKEVFLMLFDEQYIGKTAKEIAEKNNLLQESNEGEIIKIVEQVLTDPSAEQAVKDIKSGNDKAIGFLVGQVMKLSQGKANPALAQKLIREKLQ